MDSLTAWTKRSGRTTVASPEPLQPYRQTQAWAESEIKGILESTAQAIRKRIAMLGDSKGENIRRAQLTATLAAIRRTQKAMWRGKLLPAMIEGVERAEAAGESAVEALTRAAYGALPKEAAQALVDGLKASAASGLASDRARRRRALSTMVYRQEAFHADKLETLIRQGIISNLSAKELAADAYRYVNPATKGGASYAAMRLARTEINNAFHERQIDGAKRPGVTAVKWNLSGSHRVPDLCNVYAMHGGNGRWPTDEIPDKPHPQCFCYLTYITAPPDEFKRRLESGAFDDEIDRRTRENMARLGQSTGNVKATTPVTPKERVTPSGKRPKPSESLKSLIPAPADDSRGMGKLQALIRDGVPRQTILDKLTVDEAKGNQLIDSILVNFAVPNHVYPRSSNPNAPARPVAVPNAAQVKPTSSATVDRAWSMDKVEAPTGKKSKLLLDAESRVSPDMHPSLVAGAKRVLAIQETHVGRKLTRFKGIKQGITFRGAENANAAEDNGFIQLHTDLHRREKAIQRDRLSGVKCRCGHDASEGTIAHEMGHTFLKSRYMSPKQRLTLLNRLSELLDLDMPTPKLTGSEGDFARLVSEGKNWVKIRKGVSMYSTTNLNECIAEIWSDYTMNPNPSSVIRELGDVVKTLINEVKF
jgi:hypothetical protein